MTDDRLVLELQEIRKMFMCTHDTDREHDLKRFAMNKLEFAMQNERIDNYQFEDLYQEIVGWDLSKMHLAQCN